MVKTNEWVKNMRGQTNLEELLLNELSQIPFIQVRNKEPRLDRYSNDPDLIVTIELPNADSKSILVELKQNGEPRIIRDAIARLLMMTKANSDMYPIVVAPYLSPRSADMCRENGVGYMDQAGNCFISFETVFIERTGNPNPRAEKRDLRSLYSAGAERILRVLLNNPGKQWKTADLATEAAVSLGQVSNVKKLLANREWIEPFGFQLKEPFDLISEWSSQYRYNRNKIYDFFSLSSIDQLEGEIAEECQKQNIQYAMTGFSGAVRRVPGIRYQRVTAYVNNVDSLITKLNLKDGSYGGNLTLLVPYDEGVFYRAEPINGVATVSAVQAYLDLKNAKGRGEEAAEALMEAVIRKQW